MLSLQRHILVVDDDPSIRQFVSMSLNDEGYSVLTAENGAEALKLIERGFPILDLIILDMRMPVMNGLAFLEVYRQMPGYKAPVLVFTAANDNPGALTHTMARGYLAKPFDLDDLLDKIADFFS